MQRKLFSNPMRRGIQKDHLSSPLIAVSLPFTHLPRFHTHFNFTVFLFSLSVNPTGSFLFHLIFVPCNHSIKNCSIWCTPTLFFFHFCLSLSSCCHCCRLYILLLSPGDFFWGVDVSVGWCLTSVNPRPL